VHLSLDDKTVRNLDEEELRKQNERIVTTNIANEKNKPDSEQSISDEYTQKVILYGYLMVSRRSRLPFSAALKIPNIKENLSFFRKFS
jgi:hypothetical protein